MPDSRDIEDSTNALELQSFFPHTTSSFDPQEVPIDVASIKPLWKRRLHELLEHPNSSHNAFVIHILITFLILLSAGVTILETIPFFHATSPGVWFGIETSLVVLFTVEYVARAIAWSASFKLFFGWFFSFFGIVDLIAIFPYYVELLLGVDTSVMFRFSILRTFRLLRVFRAFRSNNTILFTIEVMYLSVQRSQHALLALGFFLLMFLVIFSTLLYFAERGSWDPILQTFVDADGEPTQFSSIPAAAWFVLVTITTVGYGEITPRSFLGRIITVPLLICGLLLIALPSFVLGREFSIIWEEMGGNKGVIRGRGVFGERIEEDVFMTRSSKTENEGPSVSSSTSAFVPGSTQNIRQLTDLQSAVDAQGQMIRRLLLLLDDGRGEAFGSGIATLAKRRIANGYAATHPIWDAGDVDDEDQVRISDEGGRVGKSSEEDMDIGDENKRAISDRRKGKGREGVA